MTILSIILIIIAIICFQIGKAKSQRRWLVVGLIGLLISYYCLSAPELSLKSCIIWIAQLSLVGITTIITTGIYTKKQKPN